MQRSLRQTDIVIEDTMRAGQTGLEGVNGAMMIPRMPSARALARKRGS